MALLLSALHHDPICIIENFIDFLAVCWIAEYLRCSSFGHTQSFTTLLPMIHGPSKRLITSVMYKNLSYENVQAMVRIVVHCGMQISSDCSASVILRLPQKIYLKRCPVDFASRLSRCSDYSFTLTYSDKLGGCGPQARDSSFSCNTTAAVVIERTAFPHRLPIAVGLLSVAVCPEFSYTHAQTKALWKEVNKLVPT